MRNRETAKQNEHDDIVAAITQIYKENGMYAWSNPGSQKNKSWLGIFIDIIAAKAIDAKKAWVIEVETEDSVSEQEAKEQWKDYDATYTTRWYLAVPKSMASDARSLLESHTIMHCELIIWSYDANDVPTFWGLPGL